MANPVRIVLVRPRNPDNIGAAARAMSNFGFCELAIVKPHPPVWKETLRRSGNNEPIGVFSDESVEKWIMDGEKAAPGAKHIISSARVFENVQDAVADRDTVIGTSSCKKRMPGRRVLNLRNIAGHLSRRPRTGIAILFGSEKNGLTNQELSHCSLIARISTSTDTPSMNLGQAVAVTCYALSALSLPDNDIQKTLTPPTMAEIDRTVNEICRASLTLKVPLPGDMESSAVRKALLDSDMTRTALHILRLLLARIK